MDIDKIVKIQKYLYYKRGQYYRKTTQSPEHRTMIEVMIEICNIGAEICNLLQK